MNPQQFYTLLYDMALATSGETQVKPLLIKALQRLLYHTGFPCGLYIRTVNEETENNDDTLNCLLELRICHDKSLPEQGEEIVIDRQLLSGHIELIDAHNILGSKDTFQVALRVPVKDDGCFLLLSANNPSQELPYRQLFEPIMGNFSKNLQLCRNNEVNTRYLEKEIEEHKQTLASLRESEINHKEAQRLGKIGHWILETATGELHWSDEIYRIFDRQREEFEPSIELFYETIYPDDLEKVREAIDKSSQIGFYKIEHRIVLPDETIHWVFEQAKLIKDEQGTVIQMVGTVQDITEQKQAEEEKQILMQQLQQSQKMESIGHLTGGIAHDFNNILAAMLGFAELLEALMPEIDEREQLLDYIHEIISGGERARDLVAQMLAFSRGQTGNRQDINPVPVVEDAIKLLMAMIPSSISIDTEIEEFEEMIHIDPVQLHQLVMNLVINARDAMHGKGFICIGMRTRVAKGVCNSCHESFMDYYLELHVKDTGTGIEEEVLSRIFDPFYTSKEVGKGTGMGLSVVHGIVHGNGGHIHVDTSKDKGTNISLYFPIKESIEEGKRQLNPILSDCGKRAR